MKHLFVPYTLALLAKEKGFDEHCISYWKKENDTFVIANETFTINAMFTGQGYKNAVYQNTSAPLYQQLIDWFLEKHDIWIELILFDIGFLEKDKFCFQWRIYNKSEDWFTSADECKTPTETMNLAITEAFKLISNNKN